MIQWLHQTYVKDRRVHIMTQHLMQLLPPRGKVLDIGSDDGHILQRLQRLNPALEFTDVDTLVREDSVVRVQAFDGLKLPFPNKSFDYCLFVDVLHHCEDIATLMEEACRVASQGIVLKDHLKTGILAQETLSWMDRVGNERFGVDLPHNYLTPVDWDALFCKMGLVEKFRQERLGLYPLPLDLIFGRSLHFIAKLHLPTKVLHG